MTEPAVPVATASKPARIASIDAFRGFVIMTMVFVNHLAGMEAIPAWMEHMPDGVEGMTFVDVVFPAFMFIVGMVVPVAFARRLDRGEPMASLLSHALVRVAGLIFVGVLMVNMGSVHADSTGLTSRQWSLLVYGGMILAFLENKRLPKNLLVGLHVAGWAVLALAAGIYRRADGSWLHTSYWGILGLIGWAYLTGVLCYALCRRSTTGLLGCLAMLVLVYQAGVAGGLMLLDPIMEYLGIPTQIGSHGAVVVAGIIAGVWVEDATMPHRERLAKFIIFGLGLLAAGQLLRPVHGFDKNNATDAWALASAGYTLVLFALFYWLMDDRGWRRWAEFLRPAGANPLLAYILPGIVIYVLIEIGAGKVLSFANTGGAGIARGFAFSGLILAMTAGFNRLGVVLRF